MATAARVEPTQIPKTPGADVSVDPGFNGAFYSAKAFGIATTLVTVGAFVGVWAVRASLGVQNVRGIVPFFPCPPCLMLNLPN